MQFSGLQYLHTEQPLLLLSCVLVITLLEAGQLQFSLLLLHTLQLSVVSAFPSLAAL